jgi:hypothetical protein
MEDVKTSTGGAEDETGLEGGKYLTLPFAGKIDVEEIEKKTKKRKVVKTVAEPVVEPVAVEPEPEQWVKPESEYTQVDWAALNDPPEPGTNDVAVTPTGVNVVRRGFTTLQMAIAFRNSLRDPADYSIVEVREAAGMALEGPILCHYVAHKTEEL